MESQPSSARRRRWTGVAYALLLISAIFAAWQAHDLWVSERVGGPPLEPAPAVPLPVRTSPRSRPATALPILSLPSSQSQSAPAIDVEVFPDSDVGPLREDPINIAPPEGATGLKAFAMPGSGVMAQYRGTGTVAAAAAHYKEALADQGCQLLDHSVDPGGRETLTFRGEGRRVIVALQANARDARIVDIEVTVIRLSK
jgi:hypothetical protein